MAQEIRAEVALEFDESAANMAHDPMRESWIGFEPMRTRAFMGDETVGSIAWVMLPHVADRLGAPCMNVWGLGVQERHRRGDRYCPHLAYNGPKLQTRRKIRLGGYTALECTCARDICQTWFQTLLHRHRENA